MDKATALDSIALRISIVSDELKFHETRGKQVKLLEELVSLQKDHIRHLKQQIFGLQLLAEKQALLIEKLKE